MIHLKTIKKPGEDQRFAILLQPSSKGIFDDASLYAAVRKEGSARIHRFCAEDPLRLEGAPITMTAQQFCEEWRGD